MKAALALTGGAWLLAPAIAAAQQAPADSLRIAVNRVFAMWAASSREFT